MRGALFGKNWTFFSENVSGIHDFWIPAFPPQRSARPVGPRCILAGAGMTYFFMFIIGQRINLAGNAALVKSVQAGQKDAITKEAILQEQAGVHAIDIHIAFLQSNRPRFMAQVIDQVRSVTSLALSIDDTDLEVVEAGLKQAGKKSLINSPLDVNQNLNRICSLALEFKEAQMLIVPLAQNKTPDGLRNFIETSKTILNLLEDRGIFRTRIMIDALLFSLSQARQKVLETLDRIKSLKEEVGVSSVIGLGNISYQLKNKETINAYFLRLAKKAGLDAVICDPCEKSVMEAATLNHESNDLSRDHFLKFVALALN